MKKFREFNFQNDSFLCFIDINIHSLIIDFTKNSLSKFLFFSHRPSLEIPSDGIILGCLVVFAVIPMLSLLCVCFIWILMDNLYYRNHPIFRENNPEVELIELVYVLPPDIFVHGWLQSQFKKIWGLSEKMKMEHQMLHLGNFHFFGEIEFNCGQ